MLSASLLHNEQNNYGGIRLGASAELHFRKYLVYTYLRKKKNPDSKNTMGFYVSPYAGYQYLESSNDYYTQNQLLATNQYYNSAQFGVLTGINFNIIKGIMHLDFSAGLAEKVTFTGDGQSRTHYTLQAGTTGIIPKANIQLGFNF